MKRMVRRNAVLLVGLLAALGAFEGVARAEADTFATGSGRSKAFTATAADTVVNAYAPVTQAAAANTKSVTVGATVGTGTFAAGDLVVVWQTTDGFATAPASGDQTPLQLSGTSKTGRYELARVNSATGAIVEFTFPLVNAYDPNVTQIVRVPEFTTVTVNAGASIVARAWNGNTGGIVAFLATGAVTNDGAIGADKAGFRGGVTENHTGYAGCTELDGPASLSGGAHKGEGLVSAAFSTAANAANGAYGRGNRTIGGGGGDCHNAGGGGGGHGGQGGSGGTSYALDTGGARPVGGLGGAPIGYSPSTNLVMGGGGGAGDMNNNVGTAGGAGGGVVWLRAASLAGNGNLTANGGSAANSDNDGPGGGGAGGLIVVTTTGTLACGAATANGGDGGDTTTLDHSTGGGGAGGRIVFARSGGTCNAVNAGGANGTNAANQPLGSVAGATGTSTSGAAPVVVPCDQATAKCGGCVVDADCPMGTPRCNPATHGCFESVGFGEPPINGETCTAAPPPTHGTADSCRLGICDTVDGKCGYANGTPCGTTDIDKDGKVDDGCRANTCGSDGKCGVADGGICTMNGQCRGGVCTNGVCGSPIGPDAGTSSGGGGKDGGPGGPIDDGTTPTGAAGEDSLEGAGGLACTSSGVPTGGHVALLAVVAAALASLRRKRR